VIHVDDHDDLMSPRIGVTDDGFVDLCTGSSVDIREPVSVEAAIRSGAIGQGSFLVPLLHSVPVSHLRHLCHTIYSDSRRTYHRLVKGTAPDELLEPQALRPLVNVEDGLAEPGQSSYTVTRQPHVLAATLPPDSPILVHIDLDYFNNRFNGDSDFANTPNRHDPTLSEVEEMIDELLAVLIPIGPRIASIAIGMSPGFFPGELWEPAINRLLPPLNELGARSTVG
jgi:hypothetical protein